MDLPKQVFKSMNALVRAHLTFMKDNEIYLQNNSMICHNKIYNESDKKTKTTTKWN